MISKEERQSLKSLSDKWAPDKWEPEFDDGRGWARATCNGVTVAQFQDDNDARFAVAAVNHFRTLLLTIEELFEESIPAHKREIDALRAENARLKSPTAFDHWRHETDRKVRDLHTRQLTQNLLLSEYGERLREVHVAYAREFENMKTRIAQLESGRSAK